MVAQTLCHSHLALHTMCAGAEMSDIYRYISPVINIGRFWAYRCIAIVLMAG
jgi:hypothetical protein